jgi:multiple sugar transport system permease protein
MNHDKLERRVLQAKKMLLGTKENMGLFQHLMLLTLSIGLCYVFISPLLTMLSMGLQDGKDLNNPLVSWFPTKLYLGNFERAWVVMGGWNTVFSSGGMFLLIAAVQTFSSAVIAYGFAKSDFPGRTLLFGLMVATFVIPDQVTFMPRYLMFKEYGMLRTYLPLLLPAAFGNGIRNTVFILIFYQFFRMLPKALDEAAMVDGAGYLRVFFTVSMPLAMPAIVVVFIFSFVWHWNETFLTDLYFGNAINTMPLLLERFTDNYTKIFPPNVRNPMAVLNEGIRMAATLITVLPLLAMYAIVERKLVESLDRTGITGE